MKVQNNCRKAATARPAWVYGVRFMLYTVTCSRPPTPVRIVNVHASGETYVQAKFARAVGVLDRALLVVLEAAVLVPPSVWQPSEPRT